MKSDRISIPSEIGRHGDGRRGMGNAAPGLRSDEGLVGEPDDDGICLQTLSLMNAHHNRSTLPFSPAVVVHDGDSGVGEHDGGDIGGSGDHDNRGEAGPEKLL